MRDRKGRLFNREMDAARGKLVPRVDLATGYLAPAMSVVLFGGATLPLMANRTTELVRRVVFEQITRMGRQGLRNIITGSPGMLRFSEAQSPKSINLQRSLQNGRYALSSVHFTGR